MRGQSSVEFMVWIGVSMLLFIASLTAFSGAFNQLAPARANLELQELLTALLSADSLGPEGVRVISTNIPSGISNVSVAKLPGSPEYYMSFEYAGRTWNRTTPYELHFMPEDLFERPGEHILRVSRIPNTDTVLVEGIR